MTASWDYFIYRTSRHREGTPRRKEICREGEKAASSSGVARHEHLVLARGLLAVGHLGAREFNRAESILIETLQDAERDLGSQDMYALQTKRLLSQVYVETIKSLTSGVARILKHSQTVAIDAGDRHRSTFMCLRSVANITRAATEVRGDRAAFFAKRPSDGRRFVGLGHPRPACRAHALVRV
jgi:hypothetical protein